eukprot:c14115_g1_i1 orf=67-798(+)
MGTSYKLCTHELHHSYLAPLSKHTICCRSSSRATSASLPTTIPVIKSRSLSLQSSRFSSDFFANAGLLKLKDAAIEIKGRGGYNGATTTTCSISLSGETLRWIFTAAAALLMLLKNTPINKSFLVPTLALQAPGEVITWIRGDYGFWAAFLGLLVRLFYFIPGELELPLVFVLVVITAPYQAMDLRGTTGAMVACAGVAAFLAYQHFSGTGGLRGSFKEGTFLASLAVVCLVAVPFAFLIGGF